MIPVLAVTDPEDARILFDLVNREFSEGNNDTEARARLVTLMIALHAEMNPTQPGDTE